MTADLEQSTSQHANKSTSRFARVARGLGDWLPRRGGALGIAGSRLTPIGVEIDGRFISAVQCARKPGQERLVIEAAATLMRTDACAALQAGDVERLAGVLDRQGFSGSAAVLMTPAHVQLTGVLELPPAASGAPLGQLARMEMARMHRCQPESMELAWWDLPAPRRAGESARVMAAACRLEYANGVLDLFEAQRLRVRAIDVAAWAMHRACRPLIDSQSSVVLLHVGWECCAIALLHQSVVVYERMLPAAGLKPLHARLLDELGAIAADVDAFLAPRAIESSTEAAGAALGRGALAIVESHFEPLIGEIGVSCSYVTQQYDDVHFAQVLAMGVGAALPGLTQQIERILEIPARAVAPADVADCPSQLERVATNPGMTLALGLASHAEAAP